MNKNKNTNQIELSVWAPWLLIFSSILFFFYLFVQILSIFISLLINNCYRHFRHQLLYLSEHNAEGYKLKIEWEKHGKR